MLFYIVPTAPDDYTSVEDVIIFSPGINESCTTMIPIVDDSVLENDEVFNVILSTTDSDVSLDPSSATVTIVDNDGMTPFIFLAPPLLSSRMLYFSSIRCHCGSTAAVLHRE